MKVRVSIPGAYMAVEMDEERAYRAFRKVTELLCISGMHDTGIKSVRMEDADMPHLSSPVSKTKEAAAPEVLLEPEEESGSVNEEGESETEAPVMPTSIGYGGFLYIKCPTCGEVKGFCAKTRLSNFRCDCGSVTRLKNMVPLYMNCECGRKSRYLTNLEEPMFDMTCYDCGSPVPVAWTPKKKQYETIRG